MITFKELKELIVKTEIDFMTDQLKSESELQTYISGIQDEINMCSSMDDLINWYDNYGWSKDSSYTNIIMLLMNNSTLNK